MPQQFSDRDSDQAQNINDMLKDLKLVKDRRSKNINDLGDQINESAQETEAKSSFNNDDQKDTDEEDSVCVQKIMQVPETVWEDKIVCEHKFSEKCHTTFMTDYRPTQEQRCHTSYNKKCRISYKPSVSEERISVCRDSLEKQCGADTVGETVCRVIYQTQCNTRYNEMTMEEDRPVCEVVTQTKCDDQTPRPDPGAMNMIPNFVTKKPACVEWPVKKVKPETWCEKMSQNVCAPSNCVITTGEKVCQDETRSVLVSSPSEECDLEPVEECGMETVLVPRLVERPKCIKVPREVCVTQRINPKKLFRPVIKEWCYKPSQYSSIPDNRNIRQYTNKNSLF